MVFQLVNVPCFHAHIEKMAGHWLLNDLFSSFTDPVNANSKIVLILGNYVKILNLTCPTLYTITFHDAPPSLDLYYSIHIIGRISQRFIILKENKILPDMGSAQLFGLVTMVKIIV
jgi:hypothetical protein